MLLGEDTPTNVNFESGYRSKLYLVFATVDVAGAVDVSVSDETWDFDHFTVFIDLHLGK